jgi:hypothetical protein
MLNSASERQQWVSERPPSCAIRVRISGDESGPLIGRLKPTCIFTLLIAARQTIAGNGAVGYPC